MNRYTALLVAAGISLAATACVAEDTLPATTATTPRSEATTMVPDSSATTSEPEQVTTASAAGPSTTTAPPGSDVGRFVRVTDDGATLILRVGETAVLIQNDPFSPDPTVRGDSIELVETVSVAATGNRQWEIRALRLGSATIEAEDGGVRFSISIDVSG